MFLEYNLVILIGGKLSKYLLEYQIKYPISILQMFWGLLENCKTIEVYFGTETLLVCFWENETTFTERRITFQFLSFILRPRNRFLFSL